MRLSAALALAFAISITGTVNADHHHKVWWKYLEGTWTYEDEIGKGEVTFTKADTGDAMISRWRDADNGPTSIEIVGWQADRKIALATGYGSEGGYWHVELNNITATKMEGPDHRRMRDGTVSKGKTIVTKIDEDNFTWDIIGKNEKGEEVKSHGKVTRKND